MSAMRTNLVLSLVAGCLAVAGLFAIAGCGEDAAPAEAPLPAVQPAPAAEPPPVAEPEPPDELTPEEQQQIRVKMVEKAREEITEENAAEMADALEKELDAELAE